MRTDPNFNTLFLIARQDRTMIGDGMSDINYRRARQLAKRGLITISCGPFGHELQLTRQGLNIITGENQ